jgi:hypothetical protein
MKRTAIETTSNSCLTSGGLLRCDAEIPAEWLAGADKLPSDKQLTGRMLEGEEFDVLGLEDDADKGRVLTSLLPVLHHYESSVIVIHLLLRACFLQT